MIVSFDCIHKITWKTEQVLLDLRYGEGGFQLSLCSPLLQIHAHYELKKSSRHRRNLAITGGVALSIITAPVIAAVSVGKEFRQQQFRFSCICLSPLFFYLL